GLLRTVVSIEAAQLLAGFGLAAWLLFDYQARGGEVSAVLLLIYWALNLPVLGQEMALLARQYPTHRNATLRLLEPLAALEEDDAPDAVPQAVSVPRAAASPGVALAFQGVSVRVAGHTVLSGIDLTIEPGSHVAIVGASGAGKSSLVGTLLGWYRPATGQVLV